MTDYRLRPSAEEDIDAICNYTCRSRSEAQADRYIDDLFDPFERLSLTPQLGQKAFVVATDYRRLRVNHHLIFYREVEADGIEVVRIIDERADLANKLDE